MAAATIIVGVVRPVPPLGTRPGARDAGALMRARSPLLAAAIAGLVAVCAMVALRGRGRDAESAPGTPPSAGAPSAEDARGFLYGRVTTLTGGQYEGRLRWGGGEEAFWSDSFYGRRRENPWLVHVPDELRPRETRDTSLLGIRLATRTRLLELRRPFLVRFGDIARIDADRTDVRVTLRSGTVAVLDRFEASDFDDGVRVWDDSRGVVDLDSTQIRAIEFLPTPPGVDAPLRLYGTVHTAQELFTGFLQWNREGCVSSDELAGRGEAGAVHLRFDSLRTLTRKGADACRVTLTDGTERLLRGGDLGPEHRGIYVDDPRYGRVLVSWEAFERVEFHPAGGAGSGPAYDEFAPGGPLVGRVTVRDGRLLEGRLVFDLDESETVETLDAPAAGVDYMLPFGRIAAIVPGADSASAEHAARVTLHGGEELTLAAAGDLGPDNAGVLIFPAGGGAPTYLPWPAVERIELVASHPPAASDPD